MSGYSFHLGDRELRTLMRLARALDWLWMPLALALLYLLAIAARLALAAPVALGDGL